EGVQDPVPATVETGSGTSGTGVSPAGVPGGAVAVHAIATVPSAVARHNISCRDTAAIIAGTVRLSTGRSPPGPAAGRPRVDYSCRSAAIGSMRAARTAGINVLTRPTTIRTALLMPRSGGVPSGGMSAARVAPARRPGRGGRGLRARARVQATAPPTAPATPGGT